MYPIVKFPYKAVLLPVKLLALLYVLLVVSKCKCSKYVSGILHVQILDVSYVDYLSFSWHKRTFLQSMYCIRIEILFLQIILLCWQNINCGCIFCRFHVGIFLHFYLVSSSITSFILLLSSCNMYTHTVQPC